jgi:hypothetical protein
MAAPRLASMPRRGIAAQLQHFCEPLLDFFAADPPLARALMFYSDPVAKARRDAHVAIFVGRRTCLERPQLPRERPRRS